MLRPFQLKRGGGGGSSGRFSRRHFSERLPLPRERRYAPEEIETASVDRRVRCKGPRFRSSSSLHQVWLLATGFPVPDEASPVDDVTYRGSAGTIPRASVRTAATSSERSAVSTGNDPHAMQPASTAANPILLFERGPRARSPARHRRFQSTVSSCLAVSRVRPAEFHSNHPFVRETV